MYKMSFLNDNICKEVRRIINSSKIFYRDPKEKDNYSLICAVLNRIDDSVDFLNSNDDKLSKDNDIILFIVHSCMVVDAVKIMMKNLNMNPDDYDEVNYFKSVCMSDALIVKETECIKDSKFFEYFRSLVFAHPVDTSRAKFLKKQNEIHYSPFLLSEHNSMRKNSIGIMIYSSKTPDVKLLYVPHNAIFNYINSKYELLNLIKKELENRIEVKNKEWSMCKINRNQSPLHVLYEVSNILKDRYENTYEIEELINLLEYKSSNLKNEAAVKKIKDTINLLVPKICDSIESFDYEKYSKILDEIFCKPKNMHENANYELEKIRCNLNIETPQINQDFGLSCAKSFYEQFANKWVYNLKRK